MYLAVCVRLFHVVKAKTFFLRMETAFDFSATDQCIAVGAKCTESEYCVSVTEYFGT